MLAWAVILFFFSMSMPKEGEPGFFVKFAGTWLDVALLCAGSWALYFVWKPFSAWQALPEWRVTRWAWAHTLCVPGLVLAGWLVFAVMQVPMLGVVIWLWGYWLMRARFANRLGIGFTFQWSWWAIFFVVPLLKLLAFVVGVMAMVGPIAALPLVALWAYELYRSRPLALFKQKVDG